MSLAQNSGAFQGISDNNVKHSTIILPNVIPHAETPADDLQIAIDTVYHKIEKYPCDTRAIDGLRVVMESMPQLVALCLAASRYANFCNNPLKG